MSSTVKRMQEIAKGDPSLDGMGTTFVASILLRDGGIVTVNIGDSRSYIIRPETIQQITSDHTFMGETLLSGAEVFPSLEAMKNYLTRALTPSSNDEPDFFYHDVTTFNEDGVVVAVCSDGLYKAVTNEAILSAIASNETIEEALASLVGQAEANGSNDNISAVAMEIGRFSRRRTDGIFERTMLVARKRKRMKTRKTLFWLITAVAACVLMILFGVCHRLI